MLYKATPTHFPNVSFTDVTEDDEYQLRENHLVIK